MAHLVVALDALEGGLDHVILIAAELQQLLQGVGLVHGGVTALHDGAGQDGDLAVFIGFAVHALDHVGQELGTAEVGAAVLHAGAGHALGPVGIHQHDGGAVLLQEGGTVGRGDVALVGEALALGVEPQAAVRAPGGGRAAAQDHRAARGGIDEAAGPAAELDRGAVTPAHEGEEALLVA